MRPPDPESPSSTQARTPHSPGAELPDDTSRSEHVPVSLEFDPGTPARMKVGAVWVAGFLVLGFLAVGIIRVLDARAVAKASESASGAPPPVEVVVAHSASAGEDLVLPGQAAAWYETTLHARVNGYVAKWFVDIGDHVKKGQVLATIETPALDAELAAAKASLTASQAEVAAREAEADFSKTTNERWRDAPKGVVSEQERESKKADYRSAAARWYAAQAQVALDKSRVDQYTALAEFKRVMAPFDGTITERNIDIGNLVTAGSGMNTTPLYRLAQTDPLRVFVEVPQSAAGELMDAGVPAQIRASGAVGGIFTGRITRSAESINVQARTMRVEVDMSNGEHRLVPGMYVNVDFSLPPRGLVEVPAAALIFRSTGTQVARLDAKSRVVFQNVTIARDNGSLVELTSGVNPGDRLVLNISSQISAGEAVTANEAAAPAKPLAAKR